MTLRLKRHRELEDTLWRVQEQRDAIITKLVRIEGRLKGLLKAKARLEKVMAKPSPVPVSVAEGKLLPPVEPVKPEPVLNDPIPTFLKRKQKEAKAADKLAAMPLTGKAALAAIRQQG